MKITKVVFPKTQYFQRAYNKNQIVLHHTVSSGSAKSVINYWKSDKRRVATPYIIDRQGVIYQLFDDSYYAGHVGNVTRTARRLNLPYRNCSKNSIGIELINLGPLFKTSEGFTDVYKRKYKDSDIVYYENGFRSYKYFQKYTDEQIAATMELIKMISAKHDIPLDVNLENFKTISKDAIKGVAGIYSHISYRVDKSDVHPQEELLAALKSLHVDNNSDNNNNNNNEKETNETNNSERD